MAVKSQYEQKFELEQPSLISFVDRVINLIRKMLLIPVVTLDESKEVQLKDNSKSTVNHENKIAYAFGYSMIY